MANIVITSTTNLIKVDFGVYASVVGCSTGAWRKDKIHDIKLDNNGTCIYIETLNQAKWSLSVSQMDNCMIIDSIDGVSPSNASDLYNKLVTLLN